MQTSACIEVACYRARDGTAGVRRHPLLRSLVHSISVLELTKENKVDELSPPDVQQELSGSTAHHRRPMMYTRGSTACKRALQHNKRTYKSRQRGRRTNSLSHTHIYTHPYAHPHARTPARTHTRTHARPKLRTFNVDHELHLSSDKGILYALHTAVGSLLYRSLRKV